MTMKTKRRLKSLLKYLVLACFLVLTMFPFVWMLLTSLKGSQGKSMRFRYGICPILRPRSTMWPCCGREFRPVYA